MQVSELDILSEARIASANIDDFSKLQAFILTSNFSCEIISLRLFLLKSGFGDLQNLACPKTYDGWLVMASFSFF